MLDPFQKPKEKKRHLFINIINDRKNTVIRLIPLPYKKTKKENKKPSSTAFKRRFITCPSSGPTP